MTYEEISNYLMHKYIKKRIPYANYYASRVHLFRSMKSHGRNVSDDVQDNEIRYIDMLLNA